MYEFYLFKHFFSEKKINLNKKSFGFQKILISVYISHNSL